MSTRVVIVGGGVGGLTAAVALRRSGCEVRVLERGTEISEVGAGILLQMNAVKALEAVGLADDIAACGVWVRGGHIRNLSGRILTKLEASDIPVLGVGIHRATLQRTLLQHVGPGVVRTHAPVAGYRLSSDGPVAILESGEEVGGDILVGADGIHSVIRAQHFGDEPPRYTGYTCWRGVTSSSHRFERGRVFEIWGSGQRFGGVHVDEGLYWFAPVNATAGGRDDPSRVREDLLARYRGWPESVTSTIAATPESAILRNDILDRPFRGEWGRGAMTLLGDAAHPMAPDLGQGACQAIEDAVVLARCLAGGADDPVGALRSYEGQRVPRTRRFVLRSHRFGKMAQWESPLAHRARDWMLRATPEWVIRWDMRQSHRFSV